MRQLAAQVGQNGVAANRMPRRPGPASRGRAAAGLARLGHVTRARVTQIMNLLNLAPDIQEEILFLPRTLKGRDPIRERHLRPHRCGSRLTQAACGVEGNRCPPAPPG